MMPALTIAQIAEFCQGDVDSDSLEAVITAANTLDQAGAHELAFADNPKLFGAAAASHAGCVLVPQAFNQKAQHALVRVHKPREAFAKLLRVLYPEVPLTAQIHPTALIASSAAVGSKCQIGAYVTVGEHTRIEDDCVIGDGCRIGDDVVIGSGTRLHPNVTLYARVCLGSRVILHAGCVVGADGFGYTFAGDHYEKFPQVGTVEIGDDVEIGANCCIDRAALGATRIGSGSKLDNLVHVAHNCVFGRHVAVAAQAGFSGSVSVGDYAVIGGQAGIGEKAKIEAKAIVGGKAGILTGQRIVAGEPVWGIPARPLRQHLKNLAHVAKLPKTHEELAELGRRLSKLEKEN